MDLQAIRDYIRTFQDVDEEEQPDSLLDPFIRDGHRMVQRKSARWPWLKKSWTFQTASGTAEYDLGTIAPDLELIDRINDTNWILAGISSDEAEEAYGPRGTYGTGRPAAYSIWGSTVRLWPIPDGTYSETVRGYRAPIDFVANGAGAEPDCPDDFHSIIATYALAKAFEQQQDPESAQVQMQHFMQELQQLEDRYMRDPITNPLVFNGRSNRRSSALPSPKFAWE